ncbi:uncharacterized protein PITG_15971 [Phytophthora infestans T30-4]|uniref:Secreted RxLR effector peptide protein n=1 Tax=Phytophthora infestans (strain T30-4) TaxID=403677 RepID=D0NS56_PHYIT|nr:uncharacterized protein PITG_15971 [Phytophthora infestans T30-4]EEY63597.1 hypothetical protein PITG_15971 [Phytophthora infestans T30-4]|eukprot:XP_002898184.1 hypothetical protein PITG_15971 [Phytophthora infestans T30-4]
MRFRLQFLLLALYPPTDNAAAGCKLKASALQARLQLLSAFLEAMGYYGMLTAFEDTPRQPYVPPRSPTKHLAYYLGLASADEDQDQEEGHPGNTTATKKTRKRPKKTPTKTQTTKMTKTTTKRPMKIPFYR